MTRPTAPHDPDDFELIDVAQARNWGQFVLHSVGRRKLIAFSAALLTLLATAALIFVLPKTYHVEAQLLAQRNTVMPALGNPGRTVPVEADTPTRAAAETVLRRDNLLNLMKQTDLLNRWELDRNPALRLKDVVVNAISPPSEEDRLNAMIGLLEKRLTVTTGDSTVTIAIDWPNAQLGFKLVDTALQNFLEQRHTAEVATIAETITILEGHAANLRDAIDSTMEDLKRARDPATKGRAPEAPVLRRDPAQEALKAEAAETRVLLDAKRRSITELEDFRRRRLAELQTELAQQRAVYADAHPAVAKSSSRSAPCSRTRRSWRPSARTSRTSRWSTRRSTAGDRRTPPSPPCVPPTPPVGSPATDPISRASTGAPASASRWRSTTASWSASTARGLSWTPPAPPSSTATASSDPPPCPAGRRSRRFPCWSPRA